jgi:hypothetical protein
MTKRRCVSKRQENRQERALQVQHSKRVSNRVILNSDIEAIAKEMPLSERVFDYSEMLKRFKNDGRI